MAVDGTVTSSQGTLNDSKGVAPMQDAPDDALYRDQDQVGLRQRVVGEGQEASGEDLKAYRAAAEEGQRLPWSAMCRTHRWYQVTPQNALVKLVRWLLNAIKLTYLSWVTRGLPTNYLMLLHRTWNRTFRRPNTNADLLAARLRDALMPQKAPAFAGSREGRKVLHKRQKCLEFPLLGIPGQINYIDARTSLFDDQVNRAMDDGIQQIVIIAAGFDTRAYRLSRPGVRFYEIDRPEPSAIKQHLVKQHLPEYPRPTYVAADLAQVTLADALAPTSFDPSQRSLFIFEGLSYYLPAPAMESLLQCISDAGPSGSRMCFDYLQLAVHEGRTWNPGYETMSVAVWIKNEPMLNGLEHTKLPQILGRFGYKVTEALDGPQLAAKYMPHLKWRKLAPPIIPFFNHVAGEKV